MFTLKKQYGTVFALSALVGSLMASTAMAQTDSQPWPPEFQDVPDFFGYMTPDESLETFTLPPGYNIEVAASEPLMGDAIAMSWDYDGRLWIVETTYMLNAEDLTSAEPSSSIAILEDTDGDGVMDERTEFAEGLVLPRALLILEPGKVLVGESPNILLLEDTDGDDVADERTVLTENYGARGGSIEHNPNGLFWNIDNRIYNAYLDEVYEWNGEGFDTEPGVSISQWGVTADDYGHLFRQGNSSAPSISYVADYYYGRSDIFDRERGSDEWIGGPTVAANKVWPARPTPGVNRGYRVGVLDNRGALANLTSAGGAAVYRGDAMPDLYGDIFVPEPAANLVTRSTLEDSGSGIYLQKAYDRADFLTSTEERFRPVFTSNGPDGSLYVLDLYHGIIQDAVFMSNYLWDWVDEHDLDNTHGANGRVYRITHEGTEPGEVLSLSEMGPEELVGLLDHENGWYRDNAQRLMVVQQQTEAVPALVDVVQNSDNSIARLHALWTLDGLDSVEPELVIAALNDEDTAIRSAALRIAEPWLEDAASPVTEAFLNVIGRTENAWDVQYQLAASAGELGDDNRLDALASIIELYGADYIALDAALSGVHDDEIGALLDLLLEGDRYTLGISNAITTVVSAMIRTGTAEEVAATLEAIASPDLPVWKRDVALLGAEIVLAGADDPGEAPSLVRGGPSGPRSVGTLGDRAFPEFNAEVNALDEAFEEEMAAGESEEPSDAALTEVDGVPTLVLESAPESFLQLAEDPELANRVAGVLPLMSWPDKAE